MVPSVWPVGVVGPVTGPFECHIHASAILSLSESFGQGLGLKQLSLESLN
ncbi:MAG: hypothetical protein P0116_09485 [Candidatus Nitrosocosmicus sp.]|nr:hypothetical protein [Candidatus Nitrosocosmicus sp.]